MPATPGTTRLSDGAKNGRGCEQERRLLATRARSATTCECEPHSKPDKERSGHLLQDVARSACLAESRCRATGAHRDTEVHQGPRDIEHEPEHDNLSNGIPSARIDELREECEEKQCDLRIQDIGDYALPKDCR